MILFDSIISLSSFYIHQRLGSLGRDEAPPCVDVVLVEAGLHFHVRT